MDPITLKEKIEEIRAHLRSSTSQNPETEKFFKLLNNMTSKAQGNPQEGDCPEGEDCSDLLSECCNAILITVFGTIPLQVKCEDCGKTYVLRSLLNIQKTR